MILLLLLGCPPPEHPGAFGAHGEIAPNIRAPLGDVGPWATVEQRATFDRGLAVTRHTFTRAEGLGPAFNLTACANCHERPTPGGAAGLYRNFSLAQRVTADGAHLAATSAGSAGGVVRLYAYDDTELPHPALDPEIAVVAQRNPIPFFGVGLLAELEEEVILANADPDDLDGDGISGRPNYDRGFVGRFGMKAQTVSIEGFIRGPLFNHLGVTSDPLTNDDRARLPVDSSTPTASLSLFPRAWAQAAAPDGPTTDDDAAPDPELTPVDLFDLVSFSMLLAAPPVEALTTDAQLRGQATFDAIGCADCHTPRLQGKRGPVPVYSDLLLHDMGDELADGIVQGEATGSEFRTQPLWGIVAVGPYLHDGRATTIPDAIRWHGGEGERARDAWVALSSVEQGEVLAFLATLGGRDQYSDGLIPPGTPAPAAGTFGGPVEDLSAEQRARFEAGRLAFDREFGIGDGVGAPRFNGDSCRACHFQAEVGGAGPRDVNVIRHGLTNGEYAFVPPAVGTILHRVTKLRGTLVAPQSNATIFELRQTPPLFGLGLVEAIPDAEIEALADPFDADGDGVSGRVSVVDGGRLGRFGWKAQVPTLEEFVRDAVGAELGMTLEDTPGLTFGRLLDDDDVTDPEFDAAFAAELLDFMRFLGPPPRAAATDDAAAARGEELFAQVGCDTCHVPALDGPDGPVPLYSDLLLHTFLPEDALGIEDTSADMWEFRTAPLWGLAASAPYLHDGSADTVAEAIAGHAGEATGALGAWVALPAEQQADLLVFLETL